MSHDHAHWRGLFLDINGEFERLFAPHRWHHAAVNAGAAVCDGTGDTITVCLQKVRENLRRINAIEIQAGDDHA